MSFCNDAEKGLPIAGINGEWEKSKEIRDHLRCTGTVLFDVEVSECVKAACVPHIHAYLHPLLIRMAETDGKPQPFVDPLREEISTLYRTCSRGVDDQQVVHDSWMTRKFLGFIKMKARKRQPSTDLRLYVMRVLFFISSLFFFPIFVSFWYV